MSEHGRMKTKWTIHKWRDPDGMIELLLRGGMNQGQICDFYPERFIEARVINENCLFNEGIQYLLDIITGIVSTPTL